MEQSFLEWPFFDDAHRAFAERLRAFTADGLSGVVQHEDESDAALDRSCIELARRLGAAGFLSPCIVEDASGRFDVRLLCLAREILAAHSGLADFVFAMQGLGTGPI